VITLKLHGIDLIDMKILEHLYSDVNLARIARKIGISDETVRRRLRKLYRYGRITIEPDYFALGLSYSVYITNIIPTGEITINLRILEECYILSLSRLLSPEGLRLLAVLAPPLNLEGEILNIIKGILGPGEYIPLTNPVKWRPSARYFNPATCEYLYDWSEALRKIFNGVKYPQFSLLELRSLGRMLDEIDIIIIKELHKDALTSLTDIAKKTGTYQQKIWYHFVKHVSPIIRHYDINMIFISPTLIPLSLYRIDFKNFNHLSTFIDAFHKDLHFRVMIPFRYKPSILLITQLSHPDILRFIDLLLKLKKHNIISYFRYEGIIDPRYLKAYTIPSNLFKKGRWILSKKLLEAKKIGSVMFRRELERF